MSPARRVYRPARRGEGACLFAVVACMWSEACAHRDAGLPQHFSDPTAKIHEFELPSRAAWQEPDRVVRALGLTHRAAVIADIGAGSGYFSRRLAAQVPEGKVYAVDIDDTFHRYIVEHREAWGTPNIEPRLAFYDDPALPDAEIDLVFVANSYAYIRQRTDYFRKVKKALRKGGQIVILDFKKAVTPPPDAAAPPEEHRVAPAQVVEEMKAAGFQLVREETFLAYQYLLIFKEPDGPEP